MIRSTRATDRRSIPGRIAVGLAIALMLVVMPARAQEGSSIAEKLFIEGKALMQAKDYARACEKLKASHDLDRTATGTLLNLALCHELANRPASAWAEFRQVAAESAGRREDRVAFARDHEAKLLPLLSRVRIFVPPDTRAKGLALQLDGALAIAEATWGIELPIDPGKHTVEATAPGKIPRYVEFVVGDVSDRQTLAIEPLVDAPVDPAEEALRANEAQRRAVLRRRRTIGFIVGGAGVVAVSVGLVFGLGASNENKEATGLCADNGQCPNEATRQQASDKLASARTSANVSNVTTGAGALLLAGGVVLILTALPGNGAPSTKAVALRVLHAAPVPVARGGAFVLGGEF